MSDNIAPNLREALDAGRATAVAESRIILVAATVRGVTVEVPIAFDAKGDPRALKEVTEAAATEADRVAPLRRGRYQFADVLSIMAWTHRYKTPETCAYLAAPTTSGAGSLTVIVDDLKSGDESGTNRTLRAVLPIDLHERLKEWRKAADAWLSAEAFCSFVDMAGNELSSTDLITMTQNLEIKSEAKWKRTVDPAGAVRVQTDDQSGPATRIPRDFGFAVPAFEFDETPTLFKAQLFSKIEKGVPLFMFKIVDLKRTISLAMAETSATVATAIPAEQVYAGAAP